MAAHGLQWYVRRLRAMGVEEVLRRAQQKFRTRLDSVRTPNWETGTPFVSRLAHDFPKLPTPANVPLELRDALREEVGQTLAGQWKFFGSMHLQVDTPPNWHKDYLANVDLPTKRSGLLLNHRDLPNGADIKLIWEPSRWHQLVRLAQAGWLWGANDPQSKRATETCMVWLENWIEKNPPFVGWNWTSALESAMRLIQFTWIDALLSVALKTEARAEYQEARLEKVRQKILRQHVWYTWRYRSFGSSANNHLIGELSGLILASTRWPQLVEWCAAIDVLQRKWEQEVLAQFAEDGGNEEQALNYHLFSLEFCCQVRLALESSGRKIDPKVVERLERAAQFYVSIQTSGRPWDYGDCDDATVTPLFARPETAKTEWIQWLRGEAAGNSLEFWMGKMFGAHAGELKRWERFGDGEAIHFKQSGYAVAKCGGWFVRFDVSKLGYLSTAAHGHLDALHLSFWLNGVPIVIDPGTGAYYGDALLRNHLAARSAHNGPDWHTRPMANRAGPFLWTGHHLVPSCALKPEPGEMNASLMCGESLSESGCLMRTLRRDAIGNGWVVRDQLAGVLEGNEIFSVHWQFPPGSRLEEIVPRHFLLTFDACVVEVRASPDWSDVHAHFSSEDAGKLQIHRATLQRETSNLQPGLVSPGFRRVEFGPCLCLYAKSGHNSCLFETTFLASRAR